MEDNWNRRSKRERKCYLNSLGSLYGDDVSPPAPSIPLKRKRTGEPSESDIQTALVTWADSMGLPLIAIPNEGKRTVWAATRLKRMGLTRGVSDLFLARSGKGGEHGFWIELKSAGKKPRPEQWAWLYAMREEGYRADYFDNLEDAMAAVADYLGLRK